MVAKLDVVLECLFCTVWELSFLSLNILSVLYDEQLTHVMYVDSYLSYFQMIICNEANSRNCSYLVM